MEIISFPDQIMSLCFYKWLNTACIRVIAFLEPTVVRVCVFVCVCVCFVCVRASSRVRACVRVPPEDATDGCERCGPGVTPRRRRRRRSSPRRKQKRGEERGLSPIAAGIRSIQRDLTAVGRFANRPPSPRVVACTEISAPKRTTHSGGFLLYLFVCFICLLLVVFGFFSRSTNVDCCCGCVAQKLTPRVMVVRWSRIPQDEAPSPRMRFKSELMIVTGIYRGSGKGSRRFHRFIIGV